MRVPWLGMGRRADRTADRWAEQLGEWAVPERILALAPESPWGFLPGMFEAPVGPPPDTPSRRIAMEALGSGGTVLDVGCGGGSAALALVPPATAITGVDSRPEALASLVEAGVARGIACTAVTGEWPDVAASVAAADVVVCHHVIYNVPDLGPFAAALTTHARRLVVCELGAAHPLSYIGPLWREFWDIERPSGPTAGDAVDVLRELGLAPTITVAPGVPGHWRTPEQQVHLARKRLCLPASRDAEVAAALAALPPASDEVWTLTWPGIAA